MADRARRPAALAALRELPVEEFTWYAHLMLGDGEDAIAAFDRSDRGTLIMDNYLWWPELAELRSTPSFRKLIRHLRLDVFWRERGSPDLCRSSGEDGFACD